MLADIVLLAEKGSRILIVLDSYAVLPSCMIEDGSRTLVEVSKWCRDRIGADIFCLFVLPDQATGSFVFVCRSLNDETLAVNAGFEWADTTAFAMKAEIARVVERVSQYESGEIGNHFARYNWLEELSQWLTGVCGIKIDRLEHHNAGEYFALIRIVGDGEIYWFKAVGEPNQREYAISGYLDTYFPGYVPRIVASHDLWKAWLTEDVGGSSLSEEAGIDGWVAAFRSFAELQVLSIRHTPGLLRSGAENWTIARISSEIEPFFQCMADVMQAQPKEPPSRMSAAELIGLGNQLSVLCKQLSELDIPDTLLHCDLNPGNILLQDGRPIFLDWAEAYIGHPFLCAEFLRRYFRNQSAGGDATVHQLQAAYAEVWSDYLPVDSIDRAWQIVPCIAPLFNALYLPGIDLRHVGTLERRGAFLRSLVRAMRREVVALEERRLACLR